MKKYLIGIFALAFCISLNSCGGKGNASPKSIAEKWCDLNGKVARATSDEEKDKAKAARKKYEDEMDEKYGKDEAMKKQIADEVEKCEDASEGR